MILDTKHKQQSFCKQPGEWWIYATPFDSYTRKFGFERDSASPATNLTARYCKIYVFNAVNSGHSVFQGKRKLLKHPERK